MKKKFSPSRLKLARLRNRMTFMALSEATGLSSKSLSEFEKKDGLFSPTIITAEILSEVLRYPLDFFYDVEVEEVNPITISFRSTKKIKANEKHAAEAAASLGVILNNFFSDFFSLQKSDLPDLGNYSPEDTAVKIRKEWGCGDADIENVIHLLEKKGIRIFSLSENTLNVDAFSFWKDGVPYIYLNDRKSGERSRFDAAHELGHLLMHKNELPQGRNLEEEADNFASAFLMPLTSIKKANINEPTIDNIIQLKSSWKVSAVALIVRLKNTKLISEWQYRKLMLEASEKGLKSKEINGIKRESSLFIKIFITELNRQGVDLHSLSEKTKIPLEEINNLLFKPLPRASLLAENEIYKFRLKRQF